MRILCFFVIGVLLVMAKHHHRLSEYVRYENCDQCPYHLARIGAGVGAFLEASRGVSYEVCGLNPITAKNCLQVARSAITIGKHINALLFPEPDANVSRLLPCSHIVPLCPDRGWDGRSLPQNKWSCESCRSFMNDLIKVFNTTETNSKAPTYFCKGAEESNCVAQFSDMIKLSGAMASIFTGQRTVSDMCRRTMECSI